MVNLVKLIKNKYFHLATCYFEGIKKQPPKKEAVLTQKNRRQVYRSLSTDFTSLSSFLINIFASSKQTIERNGKTGSIPFSGIEIPPDKFSSQYAKRPINKAFIMMLMLFNKICLFLFLKLKILKTPNKINMTVETLMVRQAPKTSKSCAVIFRKTAPKTAKNIQTVCILCNIFSGKSLI